MKLIEGHGRLLLAGEPISEIDYTLVQAPGKQNIYSGTIQIAAAEIKLSRDKDYTLQLADRTKIIVHILGNSLLSTHYSIFTSAPAFA